MGHHTTAAVSQIVFPGHVIRLLLKPNKSFMLFKKESQHVQLFKCDYSRTDECEFVQKEWFYMYNDSLRLGLVKASIM